ncbi:glycosyltransferase [bacterium AH-315-E07]|nr:glycosyltransferase [bacterium AH-315-E07]
MGQRKKRLICLDERYSTTRSVVVNRGAATVSGVEESTSEIKGGLRVKGYYPHYDYEDGRSVVSIITVVFNGEKFIEDAIQSVLSQKNCNIEYIVVDGASSDGTLKIIEKYKDRISLYLSGPDEGIYDAMNKGICAATGKIVGILNADDYYTDNDVVSDVVKELSAKSVDAVFSNLVIVDRDNVEKVKRYYTSKGFRPEKFAYGWMPAHPTFFVKRACYEKYGLFKTDYKIAADYELLARLLAKNKITYSFLDRVTVRMRSGGVSTRNWRSNWILNKEIVRACAENEIDTNILKVLSKYPKKVLELVLRPAL